ncbi:MAG: EpsI family protein [Nitrospira sp.]|nr:EpsI family protein [Nitrospira sp.]
MTTTKPATHMRDESDATNGWWRVALLACLMLLLYASTLKGLWDIWWSRDTYAHGVLVPFISLYLAWRRWRAVQSVPPRPAISLGLLGMTVSLAMLMIGEAGGIIALSGLSLIGMLASVTTLLFGPSYLRAYAFPIAYLIIMVPVLDLLIKPLQGPAQVITATMAVTFLQAVGIPTFREGIYIHLPNVIAEVAPGCSGLNFLISILALGIPLASVALSSMWSRLILVATGVIIAIVANWVRVALIGVHNYVWGGGLYGPFHLFQAMAVDWVGFVGLIAGTWVLSALEARRSAPGLRVALTRLEAAPLRWHDGLRRSWTLATILLLVGVLFLLTLDRGPIEPAHDLSLIPTSIGEWTALPTSNERPLLTLDEADHTLIRTYRDPQGHRIDVYIGYLSAQRQGRELVNFDARFDRLHQLAEERSESVGPISFAHNRGVWTTQEGNRPMVYWYEIGGRSYAGRYIAKWATIKQTLERRGSHGAFILLAAPAVKQENQQSPEWVRTFAKALLPFIRQSLS